MGVIDRSLLDLGDISLKEGVSINLEVDDVFENLQELTLVISRGAVTLSVSLDTYIPAYIKDPAGELKSCFVWHSYERQELILEFFWSPETNAQAVISQKSAEYFFNLP